MKPWAKNTILSVSCVATAAIFFCFGLFQGFGRGYTYRDIHASPSGAFEKVILLERLRSGKLDSAINLLESQLDSDIISHRMGLEHGPAFLHVMSYGDFSDAAKNLMIKVAKYRTDHPTQAEDPQIKAAINYVVRHYSQGQL